MSLYEDELGFDCYNWPDLASGAERWECVSPTSAMRTLNATMHLTGPSDNLTEVYTWVLNPRQNLEAAALHMKVFLGIAVPEWDDSLEWMTENIAAAQAGDARSTTRGVAFVTLEWFGLGAEEFSIRVQAR